MFWVVMMGEGGVGCILLMKGSDFEFVLFEYLFYEENCDLGYDGCEWYFVNQVVVMDMYVCLVEGVEGCVEWGYFFSLLKKYWCKKLFDVLVFGIDVVRLFMVQFVDIECQVKQLCDCIYVLVDQFGFQVLVYVVFMQIDCFEGFEVFFCGVNVKDLQKFWGVMLLWKWCKMVYLVQVFNIEFDLFVSELCEMVEQCLLQQCGVSEWLGLYLFLIEFVKFRLVLGSFIGKLFQINFYQFCLFFWGFYFMSVMQGGELVSLVGLQICVIFGLYDGGVCYQVVSGMLWCYFVGEFFNCFVLFDYGFLLCLFWCLECWQKWVFGCILVVGLVFIVVLVLSWFGNWSVQWVLDQCMVQVSESLQSSNDLWDWLCQFDGLWVQV